MDDTLLGDASPVAELTKALGESQPPVLMALNSSRPVASVQATLDGLQETLPVSAIVGALGTEIEIGGDPWKAWQAQFAEFRRELVWSALEGQGWQAHSAEFQTPFKASFAVPREQQSRARQALTELPFACRVIASGESDFDVIPPMAGKGRASVALAKELGVPDSRLLVAGDSANDLDLFEHVERGIVVGNARQELLDRVAPTVFRAEQPRAAGLLEGLRHYGAIPRV